MVKKQGKVVGVRLGLLYQAKFEALLQRSGAKKSDLIRDLVEIGLEAVEFLERREKTDIKTAKLEILELLQKRQQKLPFDKI